MRVRAKGLTATVAAMTLGLAGCRCRHEVLVSIAPGHQLKEADSTAEALNGARKAEYGDNAIYEFPCYVSVDHAITEMKKSPAVSSAGENVKGHVY